MRSVGLVLAMSDSGLEELFEARKLVEPGLPKLAAERISDADAAELRALRGGAAPTRSRIAEAFMWADIELHAKIARRRDNAVLERLLESIAGMGIASRRRTGRLRRVREQSAHDHREIAAAIAAHDASAAVRRDAAPLGERRTGGDGMIERPGKIVAIGLNYMDHVRESGRRAARASRSCSRSSRRR